MTRQDIIDEARSWAGTRWQHQASLKGVAADCVGLARGVYTELTGNTIQTPMNYPATWHLFKAEEMLYPECQKYMEEISPSEAKPGDILLFGFGKGPASHIGIMTEPDRFVHSFQDVGKAVESWLDDEWKKRIRFAFRYPGVVD